MQSVLIDSATDLLNANSPLHNTYVAMSLYNRILIPFTLGESR